MCPLLRRERYFPPVGSCKLISCSDLMNDLNHDFLTPWDWMARNELIWFDSELSLALRINHASIILSACSMNQPRQRCVARFVRS
jgi:hypothetical protein